MWDTTFCFIFLWDPTFAIIFLRILCEYALDFRPLILASWGHTLYLVQYCEKCLWNIIIFTQRRRSPSVRGRAGPALRTTASVTSCSITTTRATTRDSEVETEEIFSSVRTDDFYLQSSRAMWTLWRQCTEWCRPQTTAGSSSTQPTQIRRDPSSSPPCQPSGRPRGWAPPRRTRPGQSWKYFDCL